MYFSSQKFAILFAAYAGIPASSFQDVSPWIKRI
jgi:hypothetical protein